MSDTLTIISNNVPRELVTWQELPESERHWFEYILTSDLASEDDQYSPRFFNYRGSWYDANEFTIAPDDMRPWEGIRTETFFSGVLIRYPREDRYGGHDAIDNDHIIVGRYFA